MAMGVTAGQFEFMTEQDRCSICGAPGEFLCDFIIAWEKKGEGWKKGTLQSPSQGFYPVTTSESRIFTCNRPLCERCTTKGSPMFIDGSPKTTCVIVPDYCPDHARADDSRSPIVTFEEAESIRSGIWPR
jgi:hypothetical protein